MKTNPNTLIENPKTKEKTNLYDFLLKKANITKAPANLLKLFIKNPSIPIIKKYLTSHHVWDILKEFSKHKIAPQEICNNLLPLLPKLYSVEQTAHLLLFYPQNNFRQLCFSH